jgi:L-asparagine transporter-like permease
MQEKGLSAFQLTMMALGTVVGVLFFLASSNAVKAAGPSILLAFIRAVYWISNLMACRK